MENNKTNSENEEINGQQGNVGGDVNSELHEILYGSEYDSFREELGEDDSAPEEKLSTFATVHETVGTSKSTDITKKLRLTVILSCVFVAIIALVLILGPIGFDVFGFKQSEESPLELVEGEVATGSKSFLMFEHLERENIQRIEVHNEHGTYTVYYNNEYGQFCFEGAEDVAYDETLFSSLIVSSGYTVVSDRLSEEERNSDYSEYGLGENDDPAYYIISTRDDGRSYKVYIGDETLDGSGYYAMVDGRDQIYVMGSSVKNTLLAEMTDLLTPLLTLPIEGNDYYTKIGEYYIAHNSEPFIKISYVGETEDKEAIGVTIPFIVEYPKYFPGSTSQIQSLLTSSVNLTGDEILEIGVYIEDGKDENGETNYKLDPEIAEKYGLAEPAFDMFYTYSDYEIDTLVSFSEKQTDEDGNEFYYALSPAYDIVVKISADKLEFLEWDVVDFIERAIFNYHIDYVKTIELHAQDKDFCFNLTGTGDKLNITETYSNRILKPNPAGSNEEVLDDVYNFRQFYKTSLTIVSEDFTETPVEKVQVAEMTVTLRAGQVMTYKFYSYSDRRCYYTVNDEGEFYISRSMVRKLISDAQKVVDGVAVDSESEF